ncbi:hypothetical protein L6R49_20985 [Myxococcota bacterium]|nr:hypothetical protein [Myxococcota bacterium]
MLRLRRVHIHKYRGVLPGEELRFGPEAVFVLGRNGAGKTTFLELLTRLVACDVSHFVKEGGAVDVEWELGWESARLRQVGHTLQLRYIQEPADPPAQILVGHTNATPPAPPPIWRLEGLLTPFTQPINFSTTGNSESASAPSISDKLYPPLKFVLSHDQTFRFTNPTNEVDIAVELQEVANFEEASLLFVAWAISEADIALILNETRSVWFSALVYFSRFPQSSPIARFDEALEAFRSIVGGPGSHATLPVAEAHETGGSDSSRFIPTELLPPNFSAIPTPLTNQTFRPDALPENSRFLAPLFEAFGALDVELRPRLVEEDEQGRGLWRTFDIFVRWPGGLKQRHDHLSFGQKRMLAFLWYQAVYHEVPVFTDELTNGLHAAWARQITDLLAGRQAFHAVQNPLMLDMAGPGSEEETPSRFVLCETEVSETGRRWRWRNPTAEEAHELRVAWDAGFQSLSEILLSRGLW